DRFQPRLPCGAAARASRHPRGDRRRRRRQGAREHAAPPRREPRALRHAAQPAHRQPWRLRHGGLTARTNDRERRIEMTESHTDCETRWAIDPAAASLMGTDELRQHFLIEQLFVPGRIRLTYSHYDR